MANIPFIKRWRISVYSECNELVSSGDPKVPLYLRFKPSSAVLLSTNPESKIADLMSEAQFDELVARLKTEYFSQGYENFDF